MGNLYQWSYSACGTNRPIMANHLIAGKTAEEMALQYLQSHHLVLVERNWQCRYGEIDLIMLNKQTLVFVEVRYRKKTSLGTPAETITVHKRQKLIKTATLFLQQNNHFLTKPCQFDVISIIGELTTPSITWLPNAFFLT